MASVLSSDIVDPDLYSAMCTSLLALSNRAAQEIQRGNLKLALVEGEQAIMLLIHSGPNAILAVAAGLNRNLGMIFINTEKFLNTLNSFSEPIKST